jgi:hypothetical protein
MMFAELPEWIRQVIRELSRKGYVYVGRSGVGLSYAFRKPLRGLDHSFFALLFSRPLSRLTECMKLGTVRAIDTHMKDEDLGPKILVEHVAIEGPKWVPYERIVELCQKEPIKALRADLT